MSRVVLLCFFATTIVLAADTVRETTYLGAPACDGKTCPVIWFSNGYVLNLEHPAEGPGDRLSVWDPQGKRLYETRISFPGGEPGNAGIGAADADGTVALPVNNGDASGRVFPRHGGIVLLDQKGTRTQFIDTGRYIANGLRFADDHSIWITGERVAETGNGVAWEYGLIRHYSRDGKQLGEFLTRSSFVAAYPRGFGVWWIGVAHDRVGIMTFGPTADPPLWVEIDLAGKEIGRWHLVHEDLGRLTHAFTSDGRLFASEWFKNEKTHRLFLFDRATSSWQKQTGTGMNAFLMGAEGNDLVYWDRNPDAAGERYVWVAPPDGN